MLSIEKKKTDKVDLLKPLQQYLNSNYHSDIAREYDQVLQNIQQLREDMRNIQDKNESARDMVAR